MLVLEVVLWCMERAYILVHDMQRQSCKVSRRFYGSSELIFHKERFLSQWLSPIRPLQQWSVNQRTTDNETTVEFSSHLFQLFKSFFVYSSSSSSLILL